MGPGVGVVVVVVGVVVVGAGPKPPPMRNPIPNPATPIIMITTTAMMGVLEPLVNSLISLNPIFTLELNRCKP